MFRDGQKKIDYIIVYEDIPKVQDPNMVMKVDSREAFLLKLENLGLSIERERVVTMENTSICFVKIFAEWNILCHVAEYLSMRAPILEKTDSDSVSFLSKFFLYFFHNKAPNKPTQYYTTLFRAEKLDSFLGSDNQTTFFKDTQRIRAVDEIVRSIIYGNKKTYEIGLDRLIMENAITAGYPPHDGPYLAENGQNGKWTKRQILYHYWARWKCFFKTQPTEHIREYFGEKVTIYFEWLGFYTLWLIPATVAGIITFIYGFVTLTNNTIVKESCDKSTSFLMCPLCNENSGCEYWELNSTCFFTYMYVFFDHHVTVIYGFFISMWAILFLEFWKRKSVTLAHKWNCLGYVNDLEMPMANFIIKAVSLETNPITGAMQPAFPSNITNFRIVQGFALVFVLIIMVFGILIGIGLFSAVIAHPLKKFGLNNSLIRFTTIFIEYFLGLIFILLMSKLYSWLAYYLTKWEMHRTQTEFDNHYIFKAFLFQCVNYYSPLIYTGFFKGNFAGYPGNYTTIGGLRLQDCSTGHCLTDLSIHFVIFMVGKQLIDNSEQLVMPLVKKPWSKLQGKFSGERIWGQDFELANEPNVYDEYFGLIIQYGFIATFSATFPLVTVFALLNGLLQIRINAQKFLCYSKRSIPHRAESIGIWLPILQFLSYLAVISNAFIIAFTTEFIPQLVYQYDNNWSLNGYVNFSLAYSPSGALEKECRYRDFRDRNGIRTGFYWRVLAMRFLFIIVFEHIIYGVLYLTKLIVRDTPKSIRLKIKREHFLGKLALQKAGAKLMTQTALGGERETIPFDKNFKSMA